MTAPYFTHLSHAALTDVGRKRKNNEDSILAVPDHGVFCVADGMGGSEAGELASGTAVDHIRKALSGAGVSEYASQKGNLVRRALKEANRWIWRNAIDAGMKSCGTTAVVLVFDGGNTNRALVLHAGDSRAYRFRAGHLGQITGDHSFAAASGIADEKQLPAQFRSVITRAIGINENVTLEETPVDVEENDTFLLCSDGLTRMVPDAKVGEILGQHRGESPESVARLLIDAANNAGGHDNISVILVNVGHPEQRADIPDDGGDVITRAGHSMDEAEPSPHQVVQVIRTGRPWALRIVMGLILLALLGAGAFLAARWYKAHRTAEEEEPESAAEAGFNLETGRRERRSRLPWTRGDGGRGGESGESAPAAGDGSDAPGNGFD